MAIQEAPERHQTPLEEPTEARAAAVQMYERILTDPRNADWRRTDPAAAIRYANARTAEVLGTPEARGFAEEKERMLADFEAQHPQLARAAEERRKERQRPLALATLRVRPTRPRRTAPKPATHSRTPPRGRSSRRPVRAETASSSGRKSRTVDRLGDDDPEPQPAGLATCKGCGVEFTPSSWRQKYHDEGCSNASRQRRWYSKHRVAGPVAAADAGLSRAYVDGLRRRVEILKALPSANGSTPTLRAELGRLERSLLIEAVRLARAATSGEHWNEKRAIGAAWRRSDWLAGRGPDADQGFRDHSDDSWVPARILRGY